MPKIDIGFGSITVIRFIFETQSFQAKDGPEYPILVFPYELELYPYRDMNEAGTPLHPLTCLYIAGEFWSPQQKPAARFHEEIGLKADSEVSKTWGQLEIPLDIMTVERIEQVRTGDLAGALKFRSLLAIHSPDNFAVQRFAVAETHANGFTIPKSHWIERILPGLGHGRLELLEVRLPPIANHDFGLPNAVKEIREARDFLTAGDWDNAASHCRNAIEAIMNSKPLQLPVTATFRLKVDTFLGDNFGNSLGKEEGKYLADGMNSLWSLCSKSVHSSSSSGFNRAGAEFVVRNTMAIVEYIGRLLS